MTLEFLRCVPEQLASLITAGWRVSSASRYADGRVSILLVREVQT